MGLRLQQPELPLNHSTWRNAIVGSLLAHIFIDLSFTVLHRPGLSSTPSLFSAAHAGKIRGGGGEEGIGFSFMASVSVSVFVMVNCRGG